MGYSGLQYVVVYIHTLVLPKCGLMLRKTFTSTLDVIRLEDRGRDVEIMHNQHINYISIFFTGICVGSTGH